MSGSFWKSNPRHFFGKMTGGTVGTRDLGPSLPFVPVTRVSILTPPKPLAVGTLGMLDFARIISRVAGQNLCHGYFSPWYAPIISTPLAFVKNLCDRTKSKTPGFLRGLAVSQT